MHCALPHSLNWSVSIALTNPGALIPENTGGRGLWNVNDLLAREALWYNLHFILISIEIMMCFHLCGLSEVDFQFQASSCPCLITSSFNECLSELVYLNMESLSSLVGNGWLDGLVQITVHQLCLENLDDLQTFHSLCICKLLCSNLEPTE